MITPASLARAELPALQYPQYPVDAFLLEKKLEKVLL